MILIINVCKEKLHYFEFVRPVEKILEAEKVEFFTKHYLDLKKKDLEQCDRAIICGNSLADNEFVKKIKKLEWIKNFNGVVLGICAGMQIIGLIFGGKLDKQTEIGFFHERFENFLGLNGEQEVYHLHNYYISKWPKEFEAYSDGKIVQAVKHKNRKIYAVLFHPEVRNKEMILEFARI